MLQVGEQMLKLIKTTTLSVSALLILAGCQSTSNDTQAGFDAESYEYKGAADPLLSESAADRAGPLGDRFDLIQGRQ